MEQAASSGWISPSGAVSVTTRTAGEIQICFKFRSFPKASGPLKLGYWAGSSCFIQLKADSRGTVGASRAPAVSAGPLP